MFPLLLFTYVFSSLHVGKKWNLMEILYIFYKNKNMNGGFHQFIMQLFCPHMKQFKWEGRWVPYSYPRWSECLSLANISKMLRIERQDGLRRRAAAQSEIG